MGLEIVEMFMRVEEEFAITINDSEAERMTTPDDLCTIVKSRLAAQKRLTPVNCSTSRAFYRVRRELEQLGIERSHVAPHVQLQQLWTPSLRQRNYRALSRALRHPLPSNSLSFFAKRYLDTVGDLARQLAPRYSGYTDSDIWEKIRHIIADEASLPLTQITPSAHFVYDLGMD